jgi:hypothetical protein
VVYTYPPPPQTISGDIETINRFLASPTLVARRFQTVVNQRFIGDVLLSSRSDAANGSIVFEQNEGLYTDRPIEAVSPGAEYPVTTMSTGPATTAKVVKWGQDSYVTDEAIARSNFSAVDREMLKLANTLVKQVDSVCLSLIASSVTQTRAASAAWSSGTAKIFQDVMLAQAVIAGLNQGYSPDTLLVDDMTYAYVISDPTVLGAARREDAANPIYSGQFPVIGGLRILPTPNLPAAGAWVLDSTLLGGIASEQLPSPEYAQAGNGIETLSIRDRDRDKWRLRARRVFVPYVLEPNSAIRITGV